MTYRTLLASSAVWLLLCKPAVAAPPDAAQWRAEQLRAATLADRIMRRADKASGLLPRYLFMLHAAHRHHGRAFRIIFNQYVSWYQSFIGDYPAAAARFSIKQPRQKGDRTAPVADGAYKARPATMAIARLARSRRAVFFNEAHNVAYTRSLTVQMLHRLREEGFNYFAAETLYHDDTRLQERGYPTVDSGFYTREPVCAEMVRTALKLGFKVVAYEAGENATGDAREAQQARHLIVRVFDQDPHARLVVDAGYAHIKESGAYLGGKSMAQYFRKFSGIDPLTIDQTILIPHAAPGFDHPDYTAVMQRLHPRSPLVFIGTNGNPWSLRAGYDVSVFLPPIQLRRHRPTWLTLGGLRRAYPVSADICHQHAPCLLEARYADESKDAIPADRALVSPPTLGEQANRGADTGNLPATAELYLRPGSYRLTAQSAHGAVIARRNITVSSDSPRRKDSGP